MKSILLVSAGLVVGGLAGCSGPGVFSSSDDSPSVFARFHDRLTNDEPVGKAYVCSAEQPAQSAEDVAAAIVADDPFSIVPQTPQITPRHQVGIARVNDGRLPPAAPLGATNPFNRSGGTTAAAPPSSDAGRTGSSAMPTFRYASTRRNTVDSPVPHDDMIVDSAAIPQRAIWRTDVQSHSGATRSVDYAIVPRRPFLSTPTLPDATPVATANLPVEIMADGSVENYQAAFTQSSASVELSPPEVVAPEAPAPPVEEPLMPVADPAFASEAPVFTDEAPAVAPDVHEPATLAPGPTLAMVSPGAAAKIAPPPPVIEATPTPLAIYSGQTEVKPVDITEGDEVAAKRGAARSAFGLDKPLAIGLVLAFVATGAVIIRRRFS